MDHSANIPGIYIEESSFSRRSVVPAPTQIPVFIGYTEKASTTDKSLEGVPVPLDSLEDYERFFGKGPELRFSPQPNQDTFSFQSLNPRFLLYESLKMFFANGGRKAYVVSVGNYGASAISLELLKKGLVASSTVAEITATLVPDGLSLVAADYFELLRAALEQAHTLKTRMVLIDLPKEVIGTEFSLSQVQGFLSGLKAAESYFSYGAVYYPWLLTRLFPSGWQRLLMLEVGWEKVLDTEAKENAEVEKLRKKLTALYEDGRVSQPHEEGELKSIHEGLWEKSPVYRKLMEALDLELNLQPPGPALAGVWAEVDQSQGVWKAPANVGVRQVKRVSFPLSQTQQEQLMRVGVGYSLNPVLDIPARGPAWVWGARTLAGNDNEWRYITVRRLAIFLQQSLNPALQPFIFEPNNANTWQAVRYMTENFLTQLWRDGAFQGTKPQEAFVVQIGLGATMTQVDIEKGVMRMLLGFAPIMPAEFVFLEFEVKMDG